MELLVSVLPVPRIIEHVNRDAEAKGGVCRKGAAVVRECDHHACVGGPMELLARRWSNGIIGDAAASPGVCSLCNTDLRYSILVGCAMRLLRAGVLGARGDCFAAYPSHCWEQLTAAKLWELIVDGQASMAIRPTDGRFAIRTLAPARAATRLHFSDVLVFAAVFATIF